MLLLTLDYVPGREIEALGLVKGSVVNSKNLGRDVMSSVKGMMGGEITGYTKMLAEAREIATERMIAEAEAMGADAIICVRFNGSAPVQGAAGTLAYGTAVRFIDGKGTAR